MSDEEARQLLALIRKYCAVYDENPRKITLQELDDDLVMSLPEEA